MQNIDTLIHSQCQKKTKPITKRSDEADGEEGTENSRVVGTERSAEKRRRVGKEATKALIRLRFRGEKSIGEEVKHTYATSNSQSSFPPIATTPNKNSPSHASLLISASELRLIGVATIAIKWTERQPALRSERQQLYENTQRQNNTKQFLNIQYSLRHSSRVENLIGVLSVTVEHEDCEEDRDEDKYDHQHPLADSRQLLPLLPDPRRLRLLRQTALDRLHRRSQAAQIRRQQTQRPGVRLLRRRRRRRGEVGQGPESARRLAVRTHRRRRAMRRRISTPQKERRLLHGRFTFLPQSSTLGNQRKCDGAGSILRTCGINRNTDLGQLLLRHLGPAQSQSYRGAGATEASEIAGHPPSSGGHRSGPFLGHADRDWSGPVRF